MSLSGAKRTWHSRRGISGNEATGIAELSPNPFLSARKLLRYPSGSRGRKMRRRDFIRMVGGAAATCPFAARAQQRERPNGMVYLERIPRDPPSAQGRYTAFLQALEQLGWTDGRNVQIVARWSGGNSVELRKYAEELVAFAPDVILAGGGTGAEVM